jgi:hypothetical protein
MKIENIIRRVLREQEQEKLSELPPFDDFFDNDWNLALNFMNRYPNKKFYYPGDLNLEESDIKSLGNLVRVEGNLDLMSCKNLVSLGGLEYVGGYLDLRDTKIEILGNLNYVGGWLDLRGTNIETLGNLVRVGGDMDLESCQNLESLGNLKSVAGYFNLRLCKNLQSLGDLKHVGSWLDLGGTRIETLGNLKYVGSHLFLRYTPLSEKYTKEEIRNMVEVVGKVYL